MPALRPIRHEDQLSVIDHLDELRSRIIVCGLALTVAFAVCFWQNQHLISILNRALPPAAQTGLGSQQRTNNDLRHFLHETDRTLSEVAAELSGARGVSQAVVNQVGSLATAAGATANGIPSTSDDQAKPITIGVGESFTTTLLVVAYFAVLFTLPLLLYQLYAFVIPALSRDERRVAVPTMAAAPLLFIAGAVFTYFMILPPAIHFLQGYNSKQFQILVQAKTYYKFEILLMIGVGIAFQVPLFLLGLQKVGIITARTLTHNWRYAIVLIAIAAAALPGVDPVTMFFETLPLVLLYVASIVLLTVVERRALKREAREAAEAAAAEAASVDAEDAAMASSVDEHR